MLNHITMQHGYLFKVLHSRSVSNNVLVQIWKSNDLFFVYHLQNGHRPNRYIIPDRHAISLLSRDLRDTHLQALLEGRHSHIHRSSNTATTNISSDPLLSSFGLGFATSDVPEPSKPSSSISDVASACKEALPQPWESRYLSSCTTLIVLPMVYEYFRFISLMKCYSNSPILMRPKFGNYLCWLHVLLKQYPYYIYCYSPFYFSISLH
jgi:hypothetical protein